MPSSQASQPRTNEVKRSNKVTFFTLPAEIRLRIYDLLLINRFDRTENGDRYQKSVVLPTRDITIDESDNICEVAR
jgi:hypothetical protein